MRLSCLLIFLIFLAACAPAPATEELRPTEATTEAPATMAASDTPASPQPTATAMAVSDLPAIELLAGAADSCVNEEAYGRVLGFDVRYHELTTANRVHHRFEDAEGNILSEEDSSGENKNGEESWGFYPLAYELPADSLLTLTIEVYETAEEGAELSSTSSITFNCTTGAVTETSFERAGS